MPVYEYECLKCGDRFEEIQKFSDAPLKKHNGCGGKVKRLLSAPAIQFKGSGWYITDYARKGTDGDGKKKVDSESKAETKAETKSESKSETKSESKSTHTTTKS
jgi:putative FmdB family regulatory protein